MTGNSDIDKLVELAGRARKRPWVGVGVRAGRDSDLFTSRPVDREFAVAVCNAFDALIAEILDWRHCAQAASDEACAGEKHCSCVPLLRKRVAELRVEVENRERLAESYRRLMQR